MAFPEKPRWYGAPVLVRRNVRKLWRSLGILVGLSLLIAAAVAVILGQSRAGSFQIFLQYAVGIPLLVVFPAGCSLAVFFLLRLTSNAIAAVLHTTEPHFRLAIEGIIGLAGSALFVFCFVWLARLVGIEFGPG